MRRTPAAVVVPPFDCDPVGTPMYHPSFWNNEAALVQKAAVTASMGGLISDYITLLRTTGTVPWYEFHVVPS